MQKPKIGSVVVLNEDLDITNKEKQSTPHDIIAKDTLGVVLAVVEDVKSWGIKSLTIDFGIRTGIIVENMSFIRPYEMPKVAKKAKDNVTAKI